MKMGRGREPLKLISNSFTVKAQSITFCHFQRLLRNASCKNSVSCRAFPGLEGSTSRLYEQNQRRKNNNFNVYQQEKYILFSPFQVKDGKCEGKIPCNRAWPGEKGSARQPNLCKCECVHSLEHMHLHVDRK